MYIPIHITAISEKQAMNLKKIKEGQMGEFKKKKGKG